jgi:hypothetical protein
MCERCAQEKINVINDQLGLDVYRHKALAIIADAALRATPDAAAMLDASKHPEFADKCQRELEAELDKLSPQEIVQAWGYSRAAVEYNRFAGFALKAAAERIFDTRPELLPDHVVKELEEAAPARRQYSDLVAKGVPPELASIMAQMGVEVEIVDHRKKGEAPVS